MGIKYILIWNFNSLFFEIEYFKIHFSVPDFLTAIFSIAIVPLVNSGLHRDIEKQFVIGGQLQFRYYLT